MSPDDYRRALQAAVREYEALGLRRRAIDQRLAELAQTIGTLSRLLGLTPTVPIGLTDAIRLVMRGSGLPMTPVEVRDRLRAIGFDVSKYSNDVAAVHTILKRLNTAGELRFISRAPGRHQYALNRAAVPVVLGADVVRYMRENALEREAMTAREEPRDRARPKRPASAKPGRGPR
jgi:hypothetical protein